MQEILRKQIEERKETVNKVWKIYNDEMMRLIENPNFKAGCFCTGKIY